MKIEKKSYRQKSWQKCCDDREGFNPVRGDHCEGDWGAW
jgi:hypothetical protein